MCEQLTQVPTVTVIFIKVLDPVLTESGDAIYFYIKLLMTKYFQSVL